MKKVLALLLLFALPVFPQWNTVHYANWELDNNKVPYNQLPWQYISNMILFSGSTGGRQTNGTSPYFQAPADFLGAKADSLIKYAHKYGVKMEMDLGFNSTGQYDALFRAGDAALQVWASTVARIMVNKGYDGADFDLEGGGYPPQTTGHAHKMSYDMAKYLHDTLAVLVPGKKFCITTSIMSNANDVRGWDCPAMVADGYLDQVNPMWYDQCFPEPSPLYRSTIRSCWSNDSAVAFSIAATGIPRNKVGIGYAIQVYYAASGLSWNYSNFSDYSSLLSNPSTVFQWDDQAKARWLTNGSATLAYEDSLTGYWKADFIKKYGFGGAMGFCVGRGYLPNPPPGWNHNPAVAGIGYYLFNNVQPPTPTLTISLSGPIGIDSIGKTMMFQALISPASDSTWWFKNGIYAGTSGSSLNPTYLWTPAAAGTYTFYALAYGIGQTATSITITVNVPNFPVVTVCNYDSAKATVKCPAFPDTAAIRLSGYNAGFSAGRASCPDTAQVFLNGELFYWQSIVNLKPQK